MDWNRARIIFVCSGNICRSPMAAELTRLLFAERGFSPLIASMGTLGLVNRPADPDAVAAIAELGGDLSEHRSQALNAAMLNASDFAFGMTADHMQAIRQAGPGAFRAARAMADFAPEPMDAIWDPIGRGPEAFRINRDLIRACLERWMSSVLVRSD